MNVSLKKIVSLKKKQMNVGCVREISPMALWLGMHF